MFTFCGTYTPPPITVTEFFGIAFYTDSSVTDNGFNLTYTQINMGILFEFYLCCCCCLFVFRTKNSCFDHIDRP